jgi:hypothetical protein
MTYDNTNRGALSRNDEMEGDRDPDYRGKLNVGALSIGSTPGSRPRRPASST